jgi:hypothetical protein
LPGCGAFAAEEGVMTKAGGPFGVFRLVEWRTLCCRRPVRGAMNVPTIVPAVIMLRWLLRAFTTGVVDGA